MTFGRCAAGFAAAALVAYAHAAAPRAAAAPAWLRDAAAGAIPAPPFHHQRRGTERPASAVVGYFEIASESSRPTISSKLQT